MRIRTYRIVPFDISQWRVERKTLFGWKEVGHLVCVYDECFEMPDNFNTEVEAEKYIDKKLADEIRLAKHMKTPPREYP